MPELEHWQVQLNVIAGVTVAPGEDPVAVAVHNLQAYAAAYPERGPFTVTGQGKKRVYGLGEYAPATRTVAAPVVDPLAPPGGGPPGPTIERTEYGQVGQFPNGQWKLTFADGEAIPMPEEYLPW
jgi:hypothetical protein